MGKYSSLTTWLEEQSEPSITISIKSMENILGFNLPKSAFTYTEWWANDHSHSQAISWMSAGFKVVNSKSVFKDRTVTFEVSGEIIKKQPTRICNSILNNTPHTDTIIVASQFATGGKKQTIEVNNIIFNYVDTIQPVIDDFGNAIEMFPQKLYRNEYNKRLNRHGNGAFCKFSINAKAQAGVYLWVVNEQIIYIGETNNLLRRFNQGYGNIEPINCFIGGQSTNCKMNKVVLELYKSGKEVEIYFYETYNYKEVELGLLRCINTKYNSKDN